MSRRGSKHLIGDAQREHVRAFDAEVALDDARDCIEAWKFHCQHVEFKPRPRSMLPMPNLSGVNGAVVECYDATWRGQFRQLIQWALR